MSLSNNCDEAGCGIIGMCLKCTQQTANLYFTQRQSQFSISFAIPYVFSAMFELA
ncbi:hypothetical protein CC77DRAFT_1019745 [Alternaria alternata]|uniref:Uncharacterized protein n=1 Tax=Alternaria alternata TaxID=5599 RepID=A0A177DPL9_ALTAL|nr:hypothetical protein CC77DRAFT_1019745 [Alternaria alternata]OAG20932.1 hypothetical protein CC77DRAFT_1019745 [Alternaria alternata]